MARPTTAVRMTRLVAQWRASGDPQVRFARRHGVRPWTLWYWSRKLAERSRGHAGAVPAFVPVQMIAEPPPVAAPIEVVLVSGERLTGALVREHFQLDPLSGHWFLFRNRRGDRVKLLAWDQSGFWVCYKRLEQGTFAWPAADAGASVAIR